MITRQVCARVDTGGIYGDASASGGCVDEDEVRGPACGCYLTLFTEDAIAF